MDPEVEIGHETEDDGLDYRDRAFLKAYLELGRADKAAIQSGLCTKKKKDGTPDTVRAGIVGSQALKRLRPQLQDMMVAVGLGPMEILMGIKALTKATKSYQTKTGDVVTVSDDQTCLKAYELASKFMGWIQTSSPVVKMQAPDGPIVHQHKHSLEGKSTDELHRIFEEENRARKAVRAIGSRS